MPKPSMESIEIDRYQTEIAHDIDHLLQKYCRIMAWDIPELDQQRARQLILGALGDAVAKAKQG